MRMTLECCERVAAADYCFFHLGYVNICESGSFDIMKYVDAIRIASIAKSFFPRNCLTASSLPESFERESNISGGDDARTRRRQRQYKLTRTRKIVTIASVDAAGLINDGNFYEFGKVA